MNTNPTSNADSDKVLNSALEDVTDLKNLRADESPGNKKIDKIADKAAHKAVKREQEYDKAHTIISN
jgi:hypothetical protein